MPKEEKTKKPCHMCVKRGIETPYWKTACGLKLDKEERKEALLADEWEYVTCKSCKREKPDDDPPSRPQPEARPARGKRRRDA